MPLVKVSRSISSGSRLIETTVQSPANHPNSKSKILKCCQKEGWNGRKIPGNKRKMKIEFPDKVL